METAPSQKVKPIFVCADFAKSQDFPHFHL